MKLLFLSILLLLPCTSLAAKRKPIEFTELKLSVADYAPDERDAPKPGESPDPCQPEPFDLGKARDKPFKLSTGVGKGHAPLPDPWTLTTYWFECGSQDSSVAEFKKNGARYALYTHVAQMAFFPGYRTFTLYNWVKEQAGGWQFHRRIVDLATNTSKPLPKVDCASYVVDTASDRVMTYGLEPDTWWNDGDSRRTGFVCVWNRQGKLYRALRLGLRQTISNDETDDRLGFLPRDPETLYEWTSTDGEPDDSDGPPKKTCELRLQSLVNRGETRVIRVPNGGPSCGWGSVDLDLAGVRLKTGALRYRLSAGSDGVKWSNWRLAK